MVEAAKKKKSQKEIANDKAQRIMTGIAIWASFYRCQQPSAFRKRLSKRAAQKVSEVSYIRNDAQQPLYVLGGEVARQNLVDGSFLRSPMYFVPKNKNLRRVCHKTAGE